MKPTPTLFFYDLETSGVNPKRQRIMQFAGRRTDMDLQPIGEVVNILVSLTEDVLPDPAAILITGITPQKTIAEGYSEADFLQLLHDEVLTPGTTMLGFNSIRFDDEFMRHALYRNFYDPYEWHWKDERSRWDLLDVVRMTRALRPEGIEWPVDKDGQPTNRLELLSAANGLDHIKAHDALSDVDALIGVARLIKAKQPKLFHYLLSVRNKHKVAELVNLDEPQPFVYTSGRYPKANLHTTVAFPIAPGSKPGSVIVYDLRYDPSELIDISVQDLRKRLYATYKERQSLDFKPLPAKELQYNKCPAVAPLGVLDKAAQKRINLNLQQIETNVNLLRKMRGLGDKLREVFDRNDAWPQHCDVDEALYNGFINDSDKGKMSAVRAADKETLADFHPDFIDERLSGLLLRYKARNYPQSLSADERVAWEQFRADRITTNLAGYMQELQQLSSIENNENEQFLLNELQLWAESIAPIPEE